MHRQTREVDEAHARLIQTERDERNFASWVRLSYTATFCENMKIKQKSATGTIYVLGFGQENLLLFWWLFRYQTKYLRPRSYCKVYCNRPPLNIAMWSQDQCKTSERSQSSTSNRRYLRFTNPLSWIMALPSTLFTPTWYALRNRTHFLNESWF